MASNIDVINQIDFESILKTLGIRYIRRGSTLSLYDRGKLTDGRKADINKGIVSDFSGKGRPAGDRIEFISQHFSCSTKEAIEWFENHFGLEKPKTSTFNPIKEKWSGFLSLTQEQIDYLASRGIDYSLIKDVPRNYNGNICLPVRSIDGTIKSLQSRTIEDGKSRYYVEKNTDSDGLFYSDIDKENKKLIVVEGFTDFLSLRQYTNNVVGLINAKNEEQIKYIKELSKKYTIYFCPDNDEAGKVTIEKFEELGIKHHLFKLENYGVKDINELMNNLGLKEGVLDSIYLDSEAPKSNLRIAFEKAKGYKKLYDANDGVLGFPSGYNKLDEYTDGIIQGKVYMIMAYSNVGKTRFAYSFIPNLIKRKKKIHFYSLEVDAGMLFLELMGAILECNKQEILDNLDNIDLKDFEEYIEVYDDIRSIEGIEKNVNNTKPDVVFIDFVQNIENKLAGGEYERTTDVALRIQKLAILSGASIISISQVANDSRFQDGGMMLPKGSGALFASSDVIFSLWGKDGSKYLTIAKNKFGPAGKNFLLEVEYAKSKFKLAEEFEPVNTSTFKKF